MAAEGFVIAWSSIADASCDFICLQFIRTHDYLDREYYIKADDFLKELNGNV